jgi:hypothetical protein
VLPPAAGSRDPPERHQGDWGWSASVWPTTNREHYLAEGGIIRSKVPPGKSGPYIFGKDGIQQMPTTNLPSTTKSEPTGLFADGPCCLQALVQIDDFRDDWRENTLRNTALYLKKRAAGGDRWKTEVYTFNQTFFREPLPHDDVTAIIKSVSKNKATFTCDESPLREHCDRKLCRQRKYGIGLGKNDADFFSQLGKLSKLTVDPPIWYWETAGGRTLELTTEELQSPRMFQKRCMETLNHMPPLLSVDAWAKLIDTTLTHVIEIDVPHDSSDEGVIWEFLEECCTGHVQARSESDITQRKPWTDPETGITKFRMQDFQHFLQQKRFYSAGTRRSRLVGLFHKRGAEPGRLKDPKRTRVWVIKGFRAGGPPDIG